MRDDDPRRAPLDRYLRRVGARMRLQAWDIEVGNREPDDLGAVLAIEADHRRHYAPVFVRLEPTDELSVTFFSETREEQRQDVVHELVHLILWQPWMWVHDGSWRHQLSRREYEIVEEVFREHLESATDFLARLIAPTIPLPPKWPDGPADA